MKRLIIIVVTSFISHISLSQTKNFTSLRGIYCSMHSETFWMYDFLNDSICEFKTHGHFGDTKTVSVYKRDRNILSFSVLPKHRQDDINYFKTLEPMKIINDSCIVLVKSKEKYIKSGNGQECHSGN